MISILIKLKGMSLAKLPPYICEVNTTFEYLLEEYCSESSDITEILDQINNCDNELDPKFDLKEEEKVVASFLKNPCLCS